MLENCASTLSAEVVINLGFVKHTLSVKYNKMKPESSPTNEMKNSVEYDLINL